MNEREINLSKHLEFSSASIATPSGRWETLPRIKLQPETTDPVISRRPEWGKKDKINRNKKRHSGASGQPCCHRPWKAPKTYRHNCQPVVFPSVTKSNKRTTQTSSHYYTENMPLRNQKGVTWWLICHQAFTNIKGGGGIPSCTLTALC